MHVISVANQKGGVGKTTTAINVATALAALGQQVILVDMDPQGNASTGFGVIDRHNKLGTYDVICHDSDIEDCLIQSQIPNLKLLIAAPDLAAAEIELVYKDRREYILQQKLNALHYDYDFIIIDCPPALGLLTLNSLSASHKILVPLQCEFFALDGLSQLFLTIQKIRKNFNPRLQIDGIVLTMYDRRSALCELVAQDVRQHFNDLVYDAVIPRSVKISESPSHGQPVLIYDIKSSGAHAYMKLAGEMIKRQGLKT